MATTKKTTVHKPPTRPRPRPGCIMVELSPDDRVKLLAVQQACAEARGMPVPISWTVRIAIREMWNRLTPSDRIRFARIPDSEKTTVQA